MWSAQWIPTAVNLCFLDQSRYLFIQVAPQLTSRGWVDPVPDPLLLRRSGSAGNRTRDLCISSQKLWPPDHRGGRSGARRVNVVRCDVVSVTPTSQTHLDHCKLNHLLQPNCLTHLSSWDSRKFTERITFKVTQTKAGWDSRRSGSGEKVAICNPQFTLKKEAKLYSEELVYIWLVYISPSKFPENLSSSHCVPHARTTSFFFIWVHE